MLAKNSRVVADYENSVGDIVKYRLMQMFKKEQKQYEVKL